MDNRQESPTSQPSPSIALAIFAVALVVLGLWTWAMSSDVSYLFSAVGFAAMAPGFYFAPISLRKSFKANAEANRTIKVPGWVTGSTLAGAVLSLTCIAVRFYALPPGATGLSPAVVIALGFGFALLGFVVVYCVYRRKRS